MPTSPGDLNGALRDLIEVVRTADLEGGELDAIVGRVNALTEDLRPSVVDGPRMQASLVFGGFMEQVKQEVGSQAEVDEYTRDGQRDPGEFFPYSPIVGPLNPISLPVVMWRVPTDSGGEIHGEATFTAPFNGPPGSVHGGVVAATFDELLGCVCVTNGLGGFTGTLTVVYRSTTPLGVPLTLRGWHDRSEGRKVFAKGTLHAGETLCAEAEGIFIRAAELPGGGVPPTG